jgi:hypothetical protein
MPRGQILHHYRARAGIAPLMDLGAKIIQHLSSRGLSTISPRLRRSGNVLRRQRPNHLLHNWFVLTTLHTTHGRERLTHDMPVVVSFPTTKCLFDKKEVREHHTRARSVRVNTQGGGSLIINPALGGATRHTRGADSDLQLSVSTLHSVIHLAATTQRVVDITTPTGWAIRVGVLLAR